ncbi:MAG: Acyl transferase [Actinomycetia bacterium]|nr:Acyl transferase [Actinomycetes bacterium]
MSTAHAAIVFPGQGTQSPGMGAPWRDHPAWKIVDQAEGAMGEPLAHLLLDADADELGRTRNSQLSVLLTSLVAWEALRPLVDAPVAFGGHSLGQVTALIASGALPLEDGVRFAARRAELTQECADATPGRMVALLGATLEQAEAACAAAPDACWIANDNSDGQVVIAGTPDGVELASARAKELGVKRATPLKVGGAFHTPLMQPAADGLAEVLASVEFSVPVAPVVANDDATLHAGADGWRERSARHVAVPVRWRPCMLTLASLAPSTFVEVGNGSMLAGLGKRTVPDIGFRNVAVPSDLESLTRED